MRSRRTAGRSRCAPTGGGRTTGSAISTCEKKWDNAIAQFRKYVEVAPKDADSHDSLGEALLAKGSTDEALASYLKALSVDASFGASMHGAATCYDRKGMKSEAAKRYRQYADAYPTARDAKAARERADELEGK